MNGRRKKDKRNWQVKLSSVIHRKLPDDKFIFVMGCTVKFFISYIESKFLLGMSWDNYGLQSDNWNIDHYIPLKVFDITDTIERRICHNYRNLQPMWVKDNIRKQNILPPDYVIVHNNICEAIDCPLWKI